MIQTMTQHSQLHRANMLDWIRDCDERGAPFPTHAEIADRFRYDSVETARTLLADLADRGEIRIDRTGAISLNPVKPARISPAPRPVLPVISPAKRKKTLSAEEAAERLIASLRKPKQRKVAAEPEPAPPAPRLRVVPPTPPPVEAMPIAGLSQPEIVVSKPVQAPQPASAEPRQRKPKGPPKRLSNPIMIRLNPGTPERVQALAATEGKRQVQKIREIVETFMAAPDAVPLPCKPAVPVAVLLASIEAGKGLHEFVAELIERGLADWKRENGR